MDMWESDFLLMFMCLRPPLFSVENDVEYLFVKHGLSFLRLRGQGYDGATISNVNSIV